MKALKIILLFFMVTISSYAQISVKLLQPPPYQFKIEHFWKVIIINNGGADKRQISVYLKGTATESLQGKIIEVTSSVITLQPGVKIISGRELGPFTIRESNSRFKNIRLKTGSVPSGNYEISITVFDAKGGKQLASDYISTTVENFNRMELISPIDREVIGNIPLGNKKNLKLKRIGRSPLIIFSWLPPVPAPPGARISYRLKLVEILGYQSVYSAMASNPLYYKSLKLSSTMLRYPVAARQLAPGKKYAWAIEAFIDDFKIQESEIRSFEIAGGDKLVDKNSSNKNESVNLYGDADFNQYSGLPSGLSSYTNKNYGPSNLEYLEPFVLTTEPESPNIFKFYGDGKFTIISKSKPAQFSQLPLNYRTLEFNPRLSVYNIPFGLNIYLSSLNNSNRQSLNSVSFIFDIDQLKSKIKDRISEKVKDIVYSADSSLGKLSEIALSDPNKLKENAEKLGLISSTEKFFIDLKTLGLGRTYPVYTDLTVSGVPVNGLNVEYNPGILYLAVAAGNNLKGIDEVSFKRSFFAGRIGVGEKENDHLFFTLLKMKDDDQSILPPTNSFLTPQENQVIGTEGKILLFNNLLTLKSEAAISMFTRDLRDADIQNSSLPGFVKSIYNTKLSTSYDYALSSSVIFDSPKDNTYFSLKVNRIGPGYISLAAPNIRSDQLMFKAKFDKKFSDKKIGVKTFAKIYQDNITNWKASTTTTTSFGVSFNFNFPNIPYFIIGYSPYFQSNDAVPINQIISNNNQMVNFMTGYSYQLSSVYASTLFSFNGQWQNTKVGITSNKFSNTSYMLNQSFNFEFPLTLNSTLSLTQSKFLSTSSRITEFDLNGNYLFNDNISINLGATFSNEENFTKRSLIYIGSDIILSELLKLQLQGKISNYKDLSGGGNNYNDSMLQAIVFVTW